MNRERSLTLSFINWERRISCRSHSSLHWRNLKVAQKKQEPRERNQGLLMLLQQWSQIKKKLPFEESYWLHQWLNLTFFPIEQPLKIYCKSFGTIFEFFRALCAAAGADVDVVNIPLTPQRDPLKKRVFQFLVDSKSKGFFSSAYHGSFILLVFCHSFAVNWPTF